MGDYRRRSALRLVTVLVEALVSLRGFLYMFEFISGLPFAWAVAVLVPPAIALCVMYWLA